MFDRSFYFLRHGETDWNREGLMQGWIDIPLNETGRAQACDAIPLLETLPLDLIIASPLARARETALIVNKKLQKPLRLDPDLRERHFGVLEGKLWHDVLDQHGAGHDDPHSLFEGQNGLCPEGAETYAQFAQRVTHSVRTSLAKAPHENILFVAHGGVCRALCHALVGGAKRTPNAEPLLFEKNRTGWLLRTLS